MPGRHSSETEKDAKSVFQNRIDFNTSSSQTKGHVSTGAPCPPTLSADTDDLWLMGIVCPLVFLIVFLLYHPLKLASFDPVVATALGIPVVALHYLLMGMLAATVVAGLKTTGVVLVVALIITPASAAYLLTNRLWLMMLLASTFGGFSALAGMVLSFVTNWPSGPTMVVVATLIFVLRATCCSMASLSI